MSWIETRKQTKVSRAARLFKPKSIVIDGKTVVEEGVVLRGDLNPITIGRFCRLEKNVVVRPPFLHIQDSWTFVPVNIGDSVTIGEGSVVEACMIGKAVRIGKECVIGRGCLLRDGCVLLDCTVLPPSTVVPAFTVFGGAPGALVAELGDTSIDEIVRQSEDAFYAFKTD